MLTIKQIEQKAKLENLKERLSYLDRDYLYKTITKKQYDHEKKLIVQELCQLEDINGISNEYRKSINEMFDYPIEQIDKLIEDGRNIFQWKS